MAVIIDDAGSGDLLFGVVIGAYNDKSEDFRYDVVDVKYFQPPIFSQKLYLKQASVVVFSLLNRLKITTDEPIFICSSYIFDEAVKSTLFRDMDLENLEHIFNEIREDQLEMAIIPTGNEVTPITQIGLDKIQRRTSLISPEKVKYLYIEAARARLLNDAKTFICANCWKFSKIMQIKEIPATVQCPSCASSQLGMLNESQDPVRVLSEKIRANQRMTRDETIMMNKAIESGRLIAEHGQRAALVMAGKNLSQSDIQVVLTNEDQINDHLFELVIDAERQALRKRFW